MRIWIKGLRWAIASLLLLASGVVTAQLGSRASSMSERAVLSARSYLWIDTDVSPFTYHPRATDLSTFQFGGHYSYYTLGAIYWLRSQLLSGIGITQIKGYQHSTLSTFDLTNAVPTVSLTNARYTTTGFQPFVTYIFTHYLFADASFGYYWTNYVNQIDLYSTLVPAQTLTHSQYDGTNWNVGTGLNFLYQTKRITVRVRVGYLYNKIQQNGFHLLQNTFGGLAYVEPLTTRIDSVLDSLWFKYMVTAHTQPYVSVGTVWSASVKRSRENTPLSTTTTPLLPQTVPGRFLFNYRFGLNIFYPKGFKITLEYYHQQIRSSYDNDSYLAKLSFKM